LKRLKREDWLGFVGVDAGDLLLEDEATTSSGNSNKDPVCKEIRKFRSIMTQNLSSFPYINATEETNNIRTSFMVILTDVLFHFHIQFIQMLS
jgi:hypothetical protein